MEYADLHAGRVAVAAQRTIPNKSVARGWTPVLVGMVANNEVEFAWLDEGIKEYTDHAARHCAATKFLVQRFFGRLPPWQYSRHFAEARTDTNT